MGFLALRLGRPVRRDLNQPRGWEAGRWITTVNMSPPEEIPPTQGGPIPQDLQTTLYNDWPSSVSENDTTGGGEGVWGGGTVWKTSSVRNSWRNQGSKEKATGEVGGLPSVTDPAS